MFFGIHLFKSTFLVVVIGAVWTLGAGSMVVPDVEFRFNDMILADGLLSEAGICNGSQIHFFVQTHIVDPNYGYYPGYFRQEVEEH